MLVKKKAKMDKISSITDDLNEFPILVEFHHATVTVAIRHKEMAVCSHRD